MNLETFWSSEGWSRLSIKSC